MDKAKWLEVYDAITFVEDGLGNLERDGENTDLLQDAATVVKDYLRSIL